MNVATTHFGNLDVNDDAVIEFPAGLPGFEKFRRFLLLNKPDEPALSFMQSLESPELCFLAVPVRLLRPEYELAIEDEDRVLIGLEPGALAEIGGNVLALAIVSVSERDEPTANLLSPVVIHIESRRAVQAIRPDRRYACREPLALQEAACL